MGPMTPAAYNHWWKSRIEKEETDYAKHIQQNWQQPIGHSNQSRQQQQQPRAQQQLTLSTIGAAQLVNTSTKLTTTPAVHSQAQHSAAVQQKSLPAAAATATATATARHCACTAAEASPAATRTHGEKARASEASSHVSRAACSKSRQGSLENAGGSAASVPKAAKQAAAAAATAPSMVGSKVNAVRCAARSVVASCEAQSVVSAARSSASRATRLTAAGESSTAGSGGVGGGCRSDVSYPQTPNFSEVGSSVAASQIMSRLARLETDLAAERSKREAAEAEMRKIMASRGGAESALLPISSDKRHRDS